MKEIFILNKDSIKEKFRYVFGRLKILYMFERERERFFIMNDYFK